MPRIMANARRLAKIKLLVSDNEDITCGDLNILCVISERADGVPVSVISEQLGCSVPAVSKRLKPLEQGDFITRRADGRDHRSIKVCLTDKGMDICSRCKSKAEEIMKRITDRMGGDMDKFIELSEKFIDIAEKEINK